MVVAGVGCMSVFVYWQAVNTREPLIPLDIFGDRDFSLCNAGVAIIAFATTAMMLPLMFYTQAVCGLSPTRAALVIAPMAVANGVLAPFVGVIVDRYHPRPVLGFGFSMLAIGLTWLLFDMAPDTPIWSLLLPFGVIGAGSAFVWSPLTATATRNLPPHLAGAGSAVYNSIRQLGAVLGSAAMAAFMTWRISAEMPARGITNGASDSAITLQLPKFVREPFSAAMSQSLLLPSFIALFGIVAALFLVGSAPSALTGKRRGRTRRGHVRQDDDLIDHDYDDDDYVEFILRREPDIWPPPGVPASPAYQQEGDTEPLDERAQHRRPAPAGAWHSDLVDPSHRLPDDPAPRAQPIGFAHNGSHIDNERRFRPVAEFAPGPFESAPPDDWRALPPQRRLNGSAGHQLGQREAPRGRRYRPDPDDEPTSYGRHSSGR
jgi:hypothetical protein